MSTRRSEAADNLLLVAATAIFVLTAQRYLQTISVPEPAREPAVAAPDSLVTEIAQPGRGRLSSNPFQIPFAGWKDILWRTWQQIDEDRLLATAAGVVFFGLLAVFPAITALVSSYGLFADPSTIGANLQSMAVMLPEGSFQIVQDQIARVLAKGDTALGATFLFGLALAIWSANAGVKAVIEALNVVYGEREKRGFFRLNLLSLAFTSGAIIALMLMVSAVVALPLALDHLGLAQESKTIVSLVRWPVMFAMLLAGARRALPVRAEPAGGAMGMAQHRHAGRRPALGRRLLAAVVVSVELRPLRRHLRLARRRHRPDDVDVDVGHHRAVRRRTELGNRAPDRAGFDRRATQAARRPRRRDGGYGGTGGSGRGRRTLARRININAKLAAPGGAQDTTDGCGFRVFPGGSSLDLRASRAT